MRPRSVCVYIVGDPPPEVEAEHGDFAAWFRRLLAIHDVDVVVHDGRDGTLPAGHDELDGFVITGSPASMTAPEPWMEAGVELIRWAHGDGRPLLGVCFGHQMIGAAFGAPVVENPRGWEIGTWEVELGPAGRRDPLFDGLPERIAVNLSHRDIVDHEALSPLNGVQILAGNGKAAAQAVAAGDHIRGVQWHPEFSGAITRHYIRVRADSIAADARVRGAADEHPERLGERTVDTPHGERVFHNFIDNFVKRS